MTSGVSRAWWAAALSCTAMAASGEPRPAILGQAAAQAEVDAIGHAGALPRYRVRVLFWAQPHETGWRGSAESINASGWVTANWGQAGGGSMGYRCDPLGTCSEVPLLPAGHHGSVAAADINASAVVVGAVPFNMPYARGYRWDGTVMQFYDPFFDGCEWCFLSTSARAINAAGDVAGSADAADGTWAMLWRADGQPVRLVNWGGAYAQATDVADDGFTVGHASRPDGAQASFTFDGSRVQEVPAPPGHQLTAEAVNVHHQIVGCAIASDGSRRAFRYSSRVTLLPFAAGTSACASGINRWGMVVGWEHGVGAGQGIGFLHWGGRTVDLNRRLVPEDAAAWEVVNAADINDRGQVAVTLRHRDYGSYRAAVLEPQI